MANEEEVIVRASQIVVALADMASKGKYDDVTLEGAAAMNKLFVLVAELINKLEESEAAAFRATHDECEDCSDEETATDE